MQTKHCSACNQTKPIEDFSPIKVKNNFRTQNQSHNPYCRECRAKQSKAWRSANPGYRGTGKNSSVKNRRLMSAIRSRLRDAKLRCKKLKKDAPLLSDDYLYKLYQSQQGMCALSGVLMALETEHPHTLSLDQIDASKGYIEGNVQWLTWFVNRAKGEMSQEIFLSMCETVLVYQKVQRLSNGGLTEPSRVGPSGSKREDQLLLI